MSKQRIKEVVSNKKFWKEFFRIVPFLGLAGIILVPDDSRGVILFGVAIVLLAVALAHIVRKVIFSYIDMKTLIDKADDEPLPAALVLVGLIYLFSVVIESLIALLR